MTEMKKLCNICVSEILAAADIFIVFEVPLIYISYIFVLFKNFAFKKLILLLACSTN